MKQDQNSYENAISSRKLR